MNLRILTTSRYNWLMCNVFINRICMGIYYVHYCFQPTMQMQKYSSLWIIKSAKLNWSQSLSVCAQTELLLRLDGYVLLQLQYLYDLSVCGFPFWYKSPLRLKRLVGFDCESTHCVIQRKSLAGWKRSPDLHRQLSNNQDSETINKV